MDFICRRTHFKINTKAAVSTFSITAASPSALEMVSHIAEFPCLAGIHLSVLPLTVAT